MSTDPPAPASLVPFRVRCLSGTDREALEGDLAAAEASVPGRPKIPRALLLRATELPCGAVFSALQ